MLSQPGYLVLLAAIGMMAGLLAVDVSQLPTFGDAATPIFVGKMLAHLGAVITAFIGGKLLPDRPDCRREPERRPPSEGVTMRYVLVLLAFLALPSCASAPPLGPAATQDFQKTRVIKALDIFRDFAIDGEAATPQIVSTDTARKVVTYHQATLKILDAAGTDWRSLVATSLDALTPTLPEADRAKVAPYVALVKALLLEVQ